MAWGVRLDAAQVPEASLDVIPPRLGPEPSYDVPPLLGERVAIVVILRQVDAHRVVLGLVPAGDDVQPRSSLAHLVDGGHRLRGHDRMIEGGMEIVANTNNRFVSASSAAASATGSSTPWWKFVDPP